jgi:hypothetical protein
VDGFLDVDYIKDIRVFHKLHAVLACWDRPSGLHTVTLSVGTYPFGDDISVRAVENSEEIRLPSTLNLQPGIRYYLTIESKDAVGWSARRSSNGFTIDLVRFLMLLLLSDHQTSFLADEEM